MLDAEIIDILSTRKSAIKGTVILGVGQLVSFTCSFLRNVLIARYLTTADFGIASALALMVSALEFASKLSAGQQLIQSPNGALPSFQSSNHFVQLAAGVVSAVLMAILGPYFAGIFHVPHAAWAFSILSIACLLGGLQHLDSSRAMRDLEFGKRVLADVLPEVLLLACLYPLLLLLHDYRVIVVIMLARALLGTIASHLIAKRPFSIQFDRRFTREILLFSAPLFLNAFLLFGSQQGTQFVIGARYTIESLARYSLAVSVTMVPGFMFQYVINTVMLPILSRVQSQPIEYRERYILCLEIATVAACFVNLPLLCLSEQLVVMFFGAKYAGVGILVSYLAIANSLRILRSVTALAGMARGDTFNNLQANFVRLSGLILAYILAVNGYSLVWLAASNIVAEALSFGVSLRRLSANSMVRIGDSMAPIMLCCIISILGVLVCVFVPDVFYASGRGGAMILLFGLFAYFVRRNFARFVRYFRATVLDLPIPDVVKRFVVYTFPSAS